jgi:hypothetical protein
VFPDFEFRPARPMIMNTVSETKIFLLDDAVVEESGAGPAFELAERSAKPLLVILRVNEIIEQESLHVSVWGSADGKDWGSKPLFLFQQVFYAGATPAALNLAQRPEIKFLQARWDVNRWGRGYPRPRFAFNVEIQDLDT